MNNGREYQITSGSIADYLDDIERRWGVRLAFIVQAAVSSQGECILSIALTMPHQQHRAEIPWFQETVQFVRDSDQKKLLFKMWDQLYAADKKIEKGH